MAQEQEPAEVQMPNGFECMCRKWIDHISIQEKTEILGRIDACLAPFCTEDAAQMLHAYLALRGVVFKSFKFKRVW